MATCYRPICAGLFLLAISLPSAAQQSAHVHGSAVLNLVIDNGTLEIEFESPAINIVGFEHEAESDADRAAVRKALRTLRDPAAIFALPASANCKLKEAEAELHGHDEDHDHGHEHDKDQRHDERQEGHDHAAHDDHGDEHSEFHAHYQFACANSADLTEIGLPLFQRFPAIEEIQLQAITPWGQFGGDIEPPDAKIELK